MFLWLVEVLRDYDGIFRVFDYITLRAIFSVLTSLAISLLLGPYLIRNLVKYQIGQSIRDDGPPSHRDKSGTPTMGGVLIVISIVITTLLWSDLSNRFVWLCVLCISSFALIGWYDDYQKIICGKGISARMKFGLQTIPAFIFSAYIYSTVASPQELVYIMPVFKDLTFDLGIFFILLSMLVIVGSSNAVNLTDGLDGLAVMPIVLVCGAFAAVSYMTGNVNYSDYLSLPYVKDAGEITIFLSAIVGSGLGFLWFNAYPAQVFMGDIGALALGAALGIVAVIIRQEFLLVIMGGVFVIEAVSVILQVASYKFLGRRIFHMAPLHHHFELKGWPEPKVIVRFWIITVVLVLIGLATLKVR